LSQVNLKGDIDQVAETTVIKNPAIKFLLTKTPAEIDAWIDSNVTDLSSAKDVLIKLTQIVSILTKNAYRDFKSS